MARYFTVEEANSMLPRLRALLTEALEARARLQETRPELMQALEQLPANGGSGLLSAAADDVQRIQLAIAEIRSLGVLIKDLATGLLDFPALRDDTEVLLCWRYDEPSVAFWHYIDLGFAGRQPIDD